ncbi:fructose-bisphosphatase class III [Novipirellula artificiosorum]|uniref:fructose-bisphosphatase class III n=1 Tax=Novipirellula artificiosorum TaxID=2528016 RepID=UPI0018CC830D|nr:fructose-bisphosphatase class III [Novipirellula artificiosorum]
MPNPSEKSLTILRLFAERFPNIDSAMAEIARLSAIRTLPKGTIHVISDIHGEDQKLRHVINNASGSLRPLVEKLFGDHMDADEFRDFLTLIFLSPCRLAQSTPRASGTYLQRAARVPALPSDYADRRRLQHSTDLA